MHSGQRALPGELIVLCRGIVICTLPQIKSKVFNLVTKWTLSAKHSCMTWSWEQNKSWSFGSEHSFDKVCVDRNLTGILFVPACIPTYLFLVSCVRQKLWSYCGMCVWYVCIRNELTHQVTSDTYKSKRRQNWNVLLFLYKQCHCLCPREGRSTSLIDIWCTAVVATCTSIQTAGYFRC